MWIPDMTVTLIVGLGRTFAMTSFRVSQYVRVRSMTRAVVVISCRERVILGRVHRMRVMPRPVAIDRAWARSQIGVRTFYFFSPSFIISRSGR